MFIRLATAVLIGHLYLRFHLNTGMVTGFVNGKAVVNNLICVSLSVGSVIAASVTRKNHQMSIKVAQK